MAELQFPALQSDAGRGPVWSPIARLLKYGRWTGHAGGGGRGTRNEEAITITNGEKAMLKSATVGGQWPQDRLYKVGLVDHPNCALAAQEASRFGGR